MSTLRRSRIKASAAHLASLAGKRRVGTTEPKNDAITEEGPETPEEEKPRLKARFRPNLSESDQQRGRLRRISGCESIASPATPGGRVRTISGNYKGSAVVVII